MDKEEGMTPEKIEIYRQRYETFRHLDKIRWQMLQIAVATSSVVLVFGRGDAVKPGWWVWVAIGAIFLILGLAMTKINSGAENNGEILRKFGHAIGDTKIPRNLSKYRSVSFWIATMMIVVGLVCLVSAARYLL